MRIDEVAKRFHLSISTLRYYEKIGLLNPIHRDDNGMRNYSEEDLDRIDFVLCMKQTGLELKQIKEFIDLNKQGNETIQQRKTILLIQKKNLEEDIQQLTLSLQKLDKKIKHYDEIIQKELNK